MASARIATGEHAPQCEQEQEGADSVAEPAEGFAPGTSEPGGERWMTRSGSKPELREGCAPSSRWSGRAARRRSRAGRTTAVRISAIVRDGEGGRGGDTQWHRMPTPQVAQQCSHRRCDSTSNSECAPSGRWHERPDTAPQWWCGSGKRQASAPVTMRARVHHRAHGRGRVGTRCPHLMRRGSSE